MNICTHYGFGDYVVCYGLIKELAKQEDITMFLKAHRSDLHFANVMRLYSSIKNVNFTIDDPKDDYNVLYLGYDYLQKAIKDHPFDTSPELFYRQVGLPLTLMWDNWYFKRDTRREFEVYYGILKLKDNSKFILVHDDPERGFIIDRKYINPDFRVIKLINIPDVSILDILYLVEKATEVHTFSSGLVPFIDQMKIRHDNLNLHRYIRPLPCDQPILTLKWNIID